jgi:predicted nucleotide-binding protein (sugar kinase/HSP70/actin superfamily)
MDLDIEAFAQAATAAFAPVDLGSRCTVFMNSAVKQAQKEGATVGDISAGLSYSVVRNALYKVIKLRDPAQLGEHVVVQGGTFLNDAVLRAFELLTGREVVRPNIAGLMGAYGAALIAAERFVPGVPSSLLPPLQLRSLTVVTESRQCKLCQNHCRTTVSTFPDGSRHVSGNRCDRGANPDAKPQAKRDLPNLFEYKYKRLFAYRRLTEQAAWRGDIGIPRVLNLYENYPLWFTVFTQLGFRVLISGRSSHELFERGMDSIASENVCYPAKLVHGHIEQLLDRGVRTIWYPSISYEQRFVDGSDNCYNCPVVTSYPQVIAKNVERVREGAEAGDEGPDGGEPIRFLNPFLNLSQPGKLAERLVEVLAPWKVSLAEAKAAVAAGFEEAEAVRRDIQAEGERAIAQLEAEGKRGIVLAGRPYHVDPEVHHGIPELINGLGMGVLTEDSVSHLGSVERPLRARDQWAYHSRLYAAATAVAARPNLELVQLNSFGCGLDAITTDQVAEILHSAGGVYTCLKIDEVSNLGAARIRLRSLAAAAREREGRPVRPGEPYARPRVVFTKAMAKTHTIIAPQMSPVHFSLLAAALRAGGYKLRVLDHVSHADVDCGLTHVNNDSCYPAIMVVGQLVNAFASGAEDPDATSVMITQTGGMCRATNYVGLLRKALAEAGYPQVPVIALSTRGIEHNPGFQLSFSLVHRAMRAVALGDLFQDMLLRVRPYELTAGSADALYRRWDAIGREFLETGRTPTYGRRLDYHHLVKAAVREFDELPLRPGPRKERVGVVGEILVKFHPDANNHVVDVIEAEGREAALPGLMEFVVNGMWAAEWNLANLGTGRGGVTVKRLLRWICGRYQAPARRALRRSKRFEPPHPMRQLVEMAQEVTSLGNQAGEGWLLTAEILGLVSDGVRSVICAQPFACLPNHVTGKGMFREIRRQHPECNLVTIEYDPGASEVNQLNRIKLLLASSEVTTDTAAPDLEPDPA